VGTKLLITHTGETRAIIVNNSGQVYDTTLFTVGTFVDADWSNYLIVPTIVGTASELYTYDLGTIVLPAGSYKLVVYNTTIPAVGDTPLQVKDFTWDGKNVYEKSDEKYALDFRPKRTIYVLDTATGAATGANWDNAVTTITAALALANNGDTIQIGVGIYEETLTINQKSLTLRGLSYGTIISSTTPNSTNLTINADNITIENILFFTDTISAVRTIYASSKNNVCLRNIRIQNTSIVGSGDLNGIGIELNNCPGSHLENVSSIVPNLPLILTNCRTSLIERSLFDCDTTTPTGGAGNCIAAKITGEFKFENCTFNASNSTNGLSTVKAIEITATSAKGPRILDNCTVYAEQKLTSSGNICYGIHATGSPGSHIKVNNSRITVLYTAGTPFSVLSDNVSDRIEIFNCDVDSTKFSPITNGDPAFARIITNLQHVTDLVWRELLSDHTGVIASAAAILSEVIGIGGTLALKPTAAQIRSEMDTSSSKLLTLSTQLQTAFDKLPPDAIAGKTDVETGIILSVTAGSTTSSLNITAPGGVTLSHLEDAVIFTNTVGRVKALVRINNATGTNPSFTCPVTPSLPSIPQIGDTFLVGPKYIDTGGL